MVKIFQGLSIEQIVPDGTSGSLTEWNTSFKSGTNHNSQRGFFILHFKNSRVHINSYKLKAGDDVFPIQWNLTVSNDNRTWKAISEVNEPLCSEQNWTSPDETKNFCKYFEEKTFPANHRGYHSYVKFTLIKNSYYYNNSWKCYINLYGFELNGDFMSSSRLCTIMNRRNTDTNKLIFQIILCAFSK